MLAFNSQKKRFYERVSQVYEVYGEKSKEAAIIAAAFLDNAANSAVLNLSNIVDLNAINFDTHADHERNHLNAQMNTWSYIAGIFNLFSNLPYKEGSLFDHTTFVVVSEFSRTPYLNPAKGKDHNVYTNSVLLAGGRVNGGRSFGKSKVIPRHQREDGRAIHIGSPFDFSTGQSVGCFRQPCGIDFS